MDVLNKVPVREQEAAARAKNFEEVCLGYNMEEAMCEAERCINCKNAQCMKGCPVSINIPAFIEQVKLGNMEAAYQIISESSALPAVCGRVCPQESQCEGKCIRGMKLQGKDLFNLLNGIQDGTISFVANGESEEETGSFIYNEEQEEREEVNYGEMEEY